VDGYVCLLLDNENNITSATVVRGPLSEAIETAQQVTITGYGWGYEIWHKNRQIRSFSPGQKPHMPLFPGSRALDHISD